MGSVILSPGGLIGGGISAPRAGGSTPSIFGTAVDQGHNQSASATSLGITTLADIAAGDLVMFGHGSPTSARGLTGITGSNFTSGGLVFGNSAANSCEIWFGTATAKITAGTVLTLAFTGAAAAHGVTAFSVPTLGRAFAIDNSVPSGKIITTTTSVSGVSAGSLQGTDDLVTFLVNTAADAGVITPSVITNPIGGSTANYFVKPFYAVVANGGITISASASWVNTVSGRAGIGAIKAT